MNCVRLKFLIFYGARSKETLDKLIFQAKDCYDISEMCSRDPIKDEKIKERLVDEERQRGGRRKRHSTKRKTTEFKTPELVYEGF